VIRHLLAAALLATLPLRAEVTLQAYGEIPPSANDQLGDTIGGLGSAVSYDPKTDCVFMMPDRGAGDGTIDYRPRCYRVKIRPNPRDPKRLDYRIEETILFRDQNGRPFTGLLANAKTSPLHDGRHCLDPEAISVAPDGTLYVSDEYAPALMHFDRSGKLLREIPFPDWYLPRNSKGSPAYLSKSKLVSGSEENRGAEAMGIFPDGKRVVLIMQSALVQDGGKPAGTSRVLILDLRTGRPVAEYAYAFVDAAGFHLKFQDLSVNDIAVVNDHTFLALERDDLGRDGAIKSKTARDKAIWIVDTRGAENLLNLSDHPYDQSPSNPAFKPLERGSGVKFVRKTLLFNLPALTSQLGISADRLAAKWEGVTLLPPKSNHAFHLLMTADNDFLNPVLTFDGKTIRFPRARDAVPTQFFEILAAAL
jgi:hypothetical protein